MYGKDPFNCLPVTLNGEPRTKTLSFYGEICHKKVPTFLPVILLKKRINPHIIMVSDGCFWGFFLKICASTIVTTGRTMETLKM